MSYYDYDDGGFPWRKLGAALVALALIGVIGLYALVMLGNPLADEATNTNADAVITTSPSAPDGTITEGVTGSSQLDFTTTTTTLTATSATPRITTTSSTASTAPAATTTSLAVNKPPTTLPDGSVAPVVAIFDVETITLAGAVRSREAAERLATLAVANSKTPATVINLLTIDPAVPPGVGVRIVELTSARFPTASAEVVGDHAAELDRLAAVLNAFPNTSVLVIGHADQDGTDDNNQQLSEERAAAVVNYLERAGIDAARLSSRAVGESDLLSVNNDEASLALNRRTEFIIYGLILDV